MAPIYTQIGSDIANNGRVLYIPVSLSADGSVVAIGAPYNSGKFGHVRIYKNVNNIWTQIGSDIDGEAYKNLMGRSVSLSSDGSVVAIGAPDDYIAGTDGVGHNGYVKIYQNINNTWTQVGSKIDGLSGWDFFGESVSLSADGSSVAIGADGNDGNGAQSGHVQIYQITYSTGTTLSELKALAYIASNPDLIRAFGIDTSAAAAHYINHGKSEGRSLTAFSAADYLAKYSDLSAAFGNNETLALKHYIQDGYSEGRTDSSSSSGSTTSSPTTLSDLQALKYIASNPDLINAFSIDTSAAAAHYANHGKSEGRSLTAFSATNYLAKYSDLSAAFGNDETLALKHYIQNGYAEGRTDSSSGSGSSSGSSSGSTTSSPTTLSDLEALQYLASNTDLISVYLTGIETDIYHNILNWQHYIDGANSHYTTHGKSEGRSINSFSASDYLAKYSDLSAAFGNDETLALKHYIQSGYAEGRTVPSSSSGSTTSSPTALSDFEALNYIASHSDLISVFGNNTSAASSHYVSSGYAEGRAKDNFDEWGYLASNNDLIGAFGSNTTEAIKHYIFYGKYEGRSTNLFNAESYLNNYADLKNAFGNDHTLAKKHYVENGFNEGRLL